MEIINIQYVRNGSGTCESFYQVFFKDGLSHPSMMAIAFEDQNQIAIVDLGNPTLKWDAQEWRQKIYRAISTWEGSWDSDQAVYAIKFPFTVK